MAENNIDHLLNWFRSAVGKTIHIHHHPHPPVAAGVPGAVVQAFADLAPGKVV